MGAGCSILQFLSQGALTAGGTENEAYSLIKSRKLLKDVVDKHHLQANLEAHSNREGWREKMENNFLALKAVYLRSPKPLLEEFCCPLKVTFLDYPGENFHFLLIDLQEDGRYSVTDRRLSEKFLGEGMLSVPFQHEEFAFTLDLAFPDNSFATEPFSLEIKPLNSAVKELSNKLGVEPSKDDKSLLKITFSHRDRHLSSAVINSVMEAYQNYLKTYHANLSFKQLDYLNLRRDHSTRNLENLMNKHADYLSKDVYGAGFIDSEKEMEFLALNQHEYKEKLLANELG